MAFNPQDLLWLLLPVAAASGWIVARREQTRQDDKTVFKLPSAYFQGLNYLLNEQPDKAIEIFTQVLEVDSETVETHLALGNLFRRRGEVERAIRIHQNLIARPSLDKAQRSLALLELGQDYLKAGLFDRAENLFIELAENRLHSEQALRQLLHIYQQEKEWDHAIVICRKLARISGKPMDAVIAHYYCELAERALEQENYALSGQYARQALSSDGRCVRASLLLGDIAAAQHKDREAIKAWRRIEEQDVLFLGEVAQKIADSFRALNDETGLFRFFLSVSRRHNTASMMLTLADIIKDRDGIEAAEGFVVDWLRAKPSVHGLHRLIELNTNKPSNSNNRDLVLLLGIIEQLKQEHEGYICHNCGFKGKSLHWLCPGCNDWNTIKPAVEV